MSACGMDVQPSDWEAELGCSYDEFVAPIVERVRNLTERGVQFDRNDLVRDSFNRMVGFEGDRNFGALGDYYAGRGEGLFGRLLVYEASQGFLLTSTMNGGLHDIAGTVVLREACLSVLGRFGHHVSVLDHGSGHGRFAFGVMRTLPNCTVVVYDYPNPVLRVLKRLMSSPAYLYSEYRNRIRFHLIPDGQSDAWDTLGGKFHLVRSTEVLEHVTDPIYELTRLRSCMVDGGLMYSSTFFNSCEGQDPSHLDEHKHFQDTELLYKTYEDCGFRLIQRDENGVPKLWEAVSHA